MKNLFVFLFECCVQAVSAQNATWRFGASGANFVPLVPLMPMCQVAQTSYMKGEFLYQLFIIMSINL